MFLGDDELKKVFRDCTTGGEIRCVKIAISNGIDASFNIQIFFGCFIF